MSELKLLYSNKSIMLTNVVILVMRVTTSFNSVSVTSHVFTERDREFLLCSLTGKMYIDWQPSKSKPILTTFRLSSFTLSRKIGLLFC